jgi:hypothetical protein
VASGAESVAGAGIGAAVAKPIPAANTPKKAQRAARTTIGSHLIEAPPTPIETRS